MNKALLGMIGLGLMATVGCSSGRDIEVTGSVSAASSAAVDGEILLSFYELDAEDATSRIHIDDRKLSELGDFNETISVEGSKIVIVAINDRDGDGGCSTGEAWAEVEAEVNEDDTIEPVSIVLNNTACPATGE
ncbi:MAG: hypothetical protein AB7K71_31435 [Polyangiaceae bacterium]